MFKPVTDVRRQEVTYDLYVGMAALRLAMAPIRSTLSEH